MGRLRHGRSERLRSGVAGTVPRFLAIAMFCGGLSAAGVFSAGLAGCRTVDPLADVGAVPAAVRDSFELDPFYERYCDADGLPIVASSRVDPHALVEARRVVRAMTAARPELLPTLGAENVRLVVMAPDEFTTDIPEHSDLEPAAYWDVRARGLGATRWRPAVSCGEENLLGLPGDPYSTESILVHEFAHAIHEMALARLDPDFDPRLAAAYDAAMAAGRWEDTYAATNRQEYWAEGTQSWFDTNRADDAIHNHVDTRDEVRTYDAPLAALLEEVYGDGAWRYVPPADRPEDPHRSRRSSAPVRRFAWPEEKRRAYEAHQRAEEAAAGGDPETRE